MGKLTDEQKRNAREFFHQNELAPPYDRELEELATILAPASHVAHTAALVQALSWALDLLDMYDEKLIGLGEPSELVNSEIHLRGKAKARAALDGQP